MPKKDTYRLFEIHSRYIPTHDTWVSGGRAATNLSRRDNFPVHVYLVVVIAGKPDCVPENGTLQPSFPRFTLQILHGGNNLHL